MRVRVLELRVLAACLAGLWACVAALLLAGYRPGGPADFLVGLSALVPFSVALAAVAWPPVARDATMFRPVVALGVGTGLVMFPSIASLVRLLTDRGTQTLLPSLEAAYPWGLAILGTSLYAGLGMARRLRGPESGRRGRLAVGVLIALACGGVSIAAMAGPIVANETALRDRPAAASRFGPTDPDADPPDCEAPFATGSTARLTLDLEGTVDGRSLGVASARGVRSGTDFRWSANVTTLRTVGLEGAAVVGTRGWIRESGTRWTGVPLAVAERESLDLTVVQAALGRDRRAAAEDLGLSFVEGASARRCVVAVDGATFREAFPQVRWLVGDANLTSWRGEITAWVFSDGQVGRVEGTLGGPGFTVQPDTLRGELVARLTATDRGAAVSFTPPTD